MHLFPEQRLLSSCTIRAFFFQRDQPRTVSNLEPLKQPPITVILKGEEATGECSKALCSFQVFVRGDEEELERRMFGVTECLLQNQSVVESKHSPESSPALSTHPCSMLAFSQHLMR